MQVISDLHLETRQEKDIATKLVKAAGNSSAKYLLLAGDIATHQHPQILPFFSELQAGPWEKIFYIPGNHEYYTPKPYFQVQKELADLEKHFSKLQVLIQRKVNLPEINLLGCTLWSKLDSKKFGNIYYGLNDFQRIHKTKGIPIGWSDYLKFHQLDVDWLHETFQQVDQSKPTWVVTHHLPSYQCIHSKYQGSAYNSAFASSLEHLFPLVDTWIFGHSHMSTDLTIGQTKLVSNPLGYSHEETMNGCRFDLILPLPE